MGIYAYHKVLQVLNLHVFYCMTRFFFTGSATRLGAVALFLLLPLVFATRSAGQIQTITTEGLTFTINPHVSLQISGESGGQLRVAQVRLNELNTQNPTYIDYRGKRYDRADFNGELREYFNNLKITSVSATAHLIGFKDCTTISYAAWSVGWSERRNCTPVSFTSSSLYVESFMVSRISISGYTELVNKLRELIQREQIITETQNLLDRVEHFESLGQLEQAIRVYDEIIALNPNSMMYHRNRQRLVERLESSRTRQAATTGQRSPSGNRQSESTAAPAAASAHVSGSGLAMSLEAEGDRLLNAGNHHLALQRYLEAQQYAYSESRQQKINRLNDFLALSAISQGMDQLTASMDRAITAIDPYSLMNWSHFYVRAESGYPLYGLNPLSANTMLFGFQLNPMVFALEMRAGYVETASIEHSVLMTETRRGWGSYTEMTLPESVLVSQRGALLGFSAGAGIPLSSKRPPYLNLNINYGFDWIFSFDEKIQSDDFVQIERDGGYLPARRLSFGLLYHIRGSSMGIGVHYNILTSKGKEQGTTGNKIEYTGFNEFYRSNSQYDRRFQVSDPLDKWATNQHSTIGISLFWGLETGRR